MIFSQFKGFSLCVVFNRFQKIFYFLPIFLNIINCRSLNAINQRSNSGSFTMVIPLNNFSGRDNILCLCLPIWLSIKKNVTKLQHWKVNLVNCHQVITERHLKMYPHLTQQENNEKRQDIKVATCRYTWWMHSCCIR